ncbi:MAG: PilZ domain-containing protein [Sphingomonadaceae bacterium]|nr:PilZ domain-containing protein [Sphingomonadaceae bacterium]
MDERESIDATGDALGEGREARAAPRVPVSLRVGFRKRGMTRADGELLDLSAQGFRIDTTCVLEPGMEVWLSLPGFEPRMAHVAWVEGFQAGCKFEMPFNDYVLQSFLTRHGFV